MRAFLCGRNDIICRNAFLNGKLGCLLQTARFSKVSARAPHVLVQGIDFFAFACPLTFFSLLPLLALAEGLLLACC